MIVALVSKLIVAALAASPAMILAYILSKRSALRASDLVLHHRVAFASALLCLLPLPAAVVAMRLPGTGNHESWYGLNGFAWFLATIWVLGATQVLLESIRVHRAWQCGLGALSVAPHDLSQRVARLVEAGRRVPKVQIGDRAAAPCLHGLWCPKLILPRGVDVPDSVIRHELAHLTHRDLLWSAIYRLSSIIFWFNPLVFRLESEARLGQEMVADHDATQNADRRDYVDAILRASRRTDPSYASLALTGTAGEVERRIRAMYGSRRSANLWSTIIAFCLLFCLPFLAATKPAPPPHAAPVALERVPMGPMATMAR